jgi:hypothetical protein
MTATQPLPSWEGSFRTISADLERQRPIVREQLFNLLATLDDGWAPASYWREMGKLGFVAAHHAVHAARHAAARQDADAARAALALLDGIPPTAHTSIGDLVVVDDAACVDGPGGERCLVDPSRAPSDVSVEDVRAAIDAVVDVGLGECLRQELGVVVVLRRVAAPATTHAFSVATLPGTVFLEWPQLAARAGELLLHECGHSWLNETLALAHEDLHGDELWYSPWKRCRRSAFGIVHAVISFSLLVEYFARLAAQFRDPFVVDFARQRYAAERERLTIVRPAAHECIDQIHHDGLRGLLRAMLEEAVAGTASVVWTTR